MKGWPVRDVYVDDEYREAICEWLRANDIDPNLCPIEGRASVADGQITVDLHLLNDKGRKQLDPNHEDRLATRTVTVPLKVEPAGLVLEWLMPRCETCGR